MDRPIGSQVIRWIALSWVACTVVYLLVLSVLILDQPRFPLNLGIISTIGRTGLWITLAPALAGAFALILVLLGRRPGAAVLGVYCWFWTLVLGCALPVIWNARESFCTRTLCIRTPWIGRLLLLGLMTPFVIAALWSRKALVAAGSPSTKVG